MIIRFIEKEMISALWKGKTLVMYGPRQVGKTTLLKKIFASSQKKSLFFDAESAKTRQYWQQDNVEKLLVDLAGYDLVGLDEAQKIPNIGSILKYLHDHLPEHVQIIATGSSAFDLAQKTRESMMGRVREFFLTPFTTQELVLSSDRFSVQTRLESLLQYGMYPAVMNNGQVSSISRQEVLDTLAGSMLYKDILEIENIRKSNMIIDLLRLIALQIGSEVSYRELATKLGVSVATVQKYLYLLEESFIIFTLRGFSRNLRNEITKNSKIYFYDVGIRNALIQNWNPPELRTDIGELWENFIIAERVKMIKTKKFYGRSYFWRTHDQKEIDYIEEYDGIIHAYETKWSPKKSASVPKVFAEAYPNHTFTKINKENWIDMVMEK